MRQLEQPWGRVELLPMATCAELDEARREWLKSLHPSRLEAINRRIEDRAAELARAARSKRERPNRP